MKAPDFWAAGQGGLGAALLAPLGAVWGTVTAVRANRLPVWTAPVPVICIGNVVAGGAGKTQLCLDLAKRFRVRGLAPHILSRGYGGALGGPLAVDPEFHTAADVGDEALLLARAAPTWIGADRVASAKAACENGAHVIVMDDGFQNPALEKTLSILAVDGRYGFGNGRSIPAGPLREPPESAFRRTGVVCVLGNPEFVLPPGGQDLPRFDAWTVPDDAGMLDGKRVIAFAGIGRPEKFFATLHEAGADIVATRIFADHHAFRDDEIEPLIRDAERAGAGLVTTEKDHVRLNARHRDAVLPVPVRLQWENEAAVEGFVLSHLGLA